MNIKCKIGWHKFKQIYYQIPCKECVDIRPTEFRVCLDCNRIDQYFCSEYWERLDKVDSEIILNKYDKEIQILKQEILDSKDNHEI